MSDTGMNDLLNAGLGGDNPQDKPEDKPEDKPTDKPEDKPEDKPSDKPTDKPEDKPEDKPTDKPEDKPEDKPTDKPEDKGEKLTLEEIKKMISNETPLPEDVDENLVEAARTQIKIETLEKENTTLKGHLKQDPEKLLTDEQRAEIEELASTKGFDEAYKLRQKYEQEALKAALNNPEAQRVQRQEDLTKFLREKKIGFPQFQNAVLDSVKQQLKNGEITFQEFMDKTFETLKKISPDTVYKGKTPPSVKKAATQSKVGSSKTAQKADMNKILSAGTTPTS